MRYIYVLLTRSGTAYSHLIRALTGDEYTHVSLGLGNGVEELYSFPASGRACRCLRP